MKTVGIIGGLGPETTARFYMEVILGCSKLSKERPSILISNVALPLEVEEELITMAKGEKRVLPFLIDTAKQLEQGGADFIVIPCNTVHLFIEEIRASVGIPVLSIIEETTNFLSHNNIDEIGLLATQTTINNHLFDKSLEAVDIRIVTPTKIEQLSLGKIIHRLVRNSQTNKDKIELLRIIDNLSTRTVLLGCTDLQILVSDHKSIQIIDTMQILVQATVQELLA